jgi:uncharacterized LabA/DUF88 family protein
MDHPTVDDTTQITEEPMTTTSVFIDGGPFYDAVRGRACSVELDYPALVKSLAGTAEVCETSFYLNLAPEGPYPSKLAYQHALLDRVTTQGLTVRTGRTTIVQSTFVDRGIEGLMSTDILRAAYTTDVDTILVVSRRPDLVPAVEAAQAAGKSVQVAFFPSAGIFVTPGTPIEKELADAADTFRELTVHDILPVTMSGPVPFRVPAAAV